MGGEFRAAGSGRSVCFQRPWGWPPCMHPVPARRGGPRLCAAAPTAVMHCSGDSRTRHTRGRVPRRRRGGGGPPAPAASARCGSPYAGGAHASAAMALTPDLGGFARGQAIGCGGQTPPGGANASVDDLGRGREVIGPSAATRLLYGPCREHLNRQACHGEASERPCGGSSPCLTLVRGMREGRASSNAMQPLEYPPNGTGHDEGKACGRSVGIQH